MPRYELRVAPAGRAQVDRALDHIPRHFPEIEIIERLHDQANRVDVWICRAPSINHVQRWATASALQIATIQPHESRN